MRYKLLCLSLFAFFGSQAQQINPVPDYVFSNRMSVGRNAVTDTAAYFSIGPRYGAIRGFMPPMVVDTALVTGTKRNGLLIFSIQKNKFLYWDSVRVQWSDMAGSSGSYITGTLTNRYIPKATSSTTLGNSVMYDSSSHVRVYGNWIGNNNSSRFLFQTEIDGQNGYGAMFRQNDSLDNNIQYVMSLRKGLLTTNKPRPGFGAGYDVRLPDDTGAFRRVGAILHRLSDTTAAGLSSYMQFQVAKNGNMVNPLQIYSDSSIRMAKLAGSGTRYVVADANGDLTASASLASVDTFSISTRAWRQKGIDSVASVRIGGSGTTNYIPKFTASTTLGNSTLQTDASGNLGLGVTPSAWSGVTAAQIGHLSGLSLFGYSGTGAEIASNTYFNGTNYAYATTTTAARYALSQGQHRWFIAGSGTENTSISFTQAMTLNASGELLIGTTSDAGSYALQVAGSIYNTTGAVLAASSGNVGIGTTSPSEKLELRSGGASTQISMTIGRTSQDGLIGIAGVANNYVTGTAAGDMAIRSVANLFLGSNGANDVIFYSSGATERMRITSAGYVGIGTSSVYGQLTIANITNNVGGLNFGEASDASSRRWQIRNDVTSFGDFAIRQSTTQTGTTFTDRLYINSSGELLLGGTTDVGAYVLQAFGGFYNSGNALLNAASGETWIGGTDYGNYQLSVSNNMYVDGQSVLAGNGAAEVLLGTTSDAGTYRLQVAGNVYSTGTITTAAPSGGTAKPFKIGAAATVSPTSPNRTIEIEIDGTTYYIHAKTTND